jgi:hypothetical protein
MGSQECVGHKANYEWGKQRIARKSGQSAISNAKVRNAKEQSIIIHSQPKSWADVVQNRARSQAVAVAE